MNKINLKEEIVYYLQMLEFEKSGYSTLIKEFAEEAEEMELNLNEKNYKLILEKFNEASQKLTMAINEIIGKPIHLYKIDFNEGTLEYE